MPPAPTSSPSAGGYDLRGLFALALVWGVFGGILEGFIHLGLQRLHILDNSWYPIIWIAACVNTLVLLALVGASTLILRFLGPQRRLRVTVFFAILAGIIPWLVLGLKEWIHTYALALLALGITTVFTRAIAGNPAAHFRRYCRLVPVAVVAAAAAFVSIEGGGWLLERIAQSRLPEAKADAPNVLVIVIDALRADHVGAYGYPRQTTPAIDRLAAGGVLFETATSTSSYTLPSHASLLTGRFVHEHHVEWDTSHNRPDTGLSNLPAVLAQAGYRTGAFSGNTFYFSREHGFGRGFLHFEDYFHSVVDMFWRTAWGGILTKAVRPRLGFEDLPGRKRAPTTNSAVQSWAARSTDRPFFVMVNYMDVHDPYLPVAPYATQFGKTPPAGRLNFKLHVPDRLTDAELQAEIDAYDEALAYADAHVDALIASLRQASTRDLIVILTSDHGEEFGEHGGYLHGRHLYFETLHVPLIVWAPGRVPGGKRVGVPVSNASIPATVMSLLGLTSDFAVPSLAPMWSGVAVPEADWPVALAELKQRPWAPERDLVRHGTLRSALVGEWHVIDQERQQPKAFNWPADPRESRDLASRPDVDAIVRRVLSLFK